MIDAKTQKAKGVMALATASSAFLSTAAAQQVRVWPLHTLLPFPFFARPCPMVPRHGFVESRVIDNHGAWDALVKEVRAQEPNGEILMMPFLHCQFSGVLTESGISYGKGNDGVTGGQDARVIPAASGSAISLLSKLGLMQAKDLAAITESPYIEFVEHAGKLEAVQLRNGPAVPLSPCYVPQMMTVKQVVTPTATEIKDLLAWEARMKQLKGAEGVVIHYPGGSMHSHIAVQAVEQTKSTGTPFAVWLLPDAPTVGEQLLPQNAVAPLTSADLKQLANMLASAISSMPLDREEQALILLAVAALHASPYWDGAPHLLALRAVAVAAMLRFASSAVLGELRHWYGSGPAGSLERQTPPLDEKERAGKLSREQIYERAFSVHVRMISPRLGPALRDYQAPGWAGSFGGKKWADCTDRTIALFNAAADFIGKPTVERWGAVMQAWNGVVNVFHNTGKFLNKFINQSLLNDLATTPVLGLISPLVGDLVVHDEDFPMHRNPKAVAASLRVAIPSSKIIKKTKAPKPVPTSIPALAKDLNVLFEARVRMQDAHSIYLQVQTAPNYTSGKSYGVAFNVTVPPHVRKLLTEQLTFDGTGLSGTTTKYILAHVMEFSKGIWAINIDQTGHLIPLGNEQNALLSGIKAKMQNEEE